MFYPPLRSSQFLNSTVKIYVYFFIHHITNVFLIIVTKLNETNNCAIFSANTKLSVVCFHHAKQAFSLWTPSLLWLVSTKRHVSCFNQEKKSTHNTYQMAKKELITWIRAYKNDGLSYTQCSCRQCVVASISLPSPESCSIVIPYPPRRGRIAHRHTGSSLQTFRGERKEIL